MPDRHLFLLSPYRPPTSYPVSLPVDELSAWLNGYAALWHPRALAGAVGPPQVASAYDHDQPHDAAVYAVPVGPHLYQPDDWADRLATVGACSFRPTTNRVETLDLLRAMCDGPDPSPAIVRAFAGLGFGYLTLDTLCDAMSHDRLLDTTAFWAAVNEAIAADEAGAMQALKQAAELLRLAREGMTANAMYLTDWVRLDDGTPTIPDGPVAIFASAETLDRLAAADPTHFAELVARPDVEFCCGAVRERDDAFLPVESQVWNLVAARERVQARTGRPAEVFARWRSAFGPHSPSWLSHAGYRSAVATTFDGALAPTRYASVVQWPAPDGRAIAAVTKEPLSADDPSTFFNLGYHVHQASTHDATPLVALLHRGKPHAESCADWHALAALAPVFGRRATLGEFLADASAGDYTGPSAADEFFSDALDRRVTEVRPDPVSGFVKHDRLRRRLDSAFALTSLHRSLTDPTSDDVEFDGKLAGLEADAETRGPDIGAAGEPDALAEKIAVAETEAAGKLAARVQARAADGQSGVLVFNPCGFARRVAIEVPNLAGPFAVAGPVKASEYTDNLARAVVEVPGFGFAWLPRPVAGPNPKPKLITANGTTVRNEFFEAELDPATGGLRSFRDARTRINRLGQMLAFNPGSKMRATSVRVTHAGVAVGEAVSEGVLVDDHDVTLATFRQRIRAWVGRPAIELRIEIRPVKSPTGYAWHSYYAARFAWRDERSAIFRSVGGATSQSTYPRPCSPDFVEVRFGSQRSFAFTGGLPFVQKQGGRMFDVVLIPEGETETTFDLLLSADREHPIQVAAGWAAPAPVVLTEKGPPAAGPTGWLAHIDMPSLAVTTLRPGVGRSVVARLLETSGHAGSAEVLFARTPTAAHTCDAAGVSSNPIALTGDGVPVDFSANELFTVRAEWA